MNVPSYTMEMHPISQNSGYHGIGSTTSTVSGLQYGEPIGPPFQEAVNRSMRDVIFINPPSIRDYGDDP